MKPSWGVRWWGLASSRSRRSRSGCGLRSSQQELPPDITAATLKLQGLGTQPVIIAQPKQSTQKIKKNPNSPSDKHCNALTKIIQSAELLCLKCGGYRVTNITRIAIV